MFKQDTNDRAAWHQGPPADCAVPRGKVEPPWRLVLLGAPGVGKGTQAELLHQHLGACHLSTGDLLRAASRPNCVQSPAMMAAQELMRHGNLVPDATIWEMVRERFACLRCSGGFLLDGFPRTLGQAESLNELMHEERLSLSAVVDYELPVTEIISRLSSRRTCEKCESVFTITRESSKAQDLCPHCGGLLFQREDDHPEAVTVRLKVYERDTAPLIQYYQRLGLLLPIDASGSPEQVCARTMIALQHRFQPTA